MSSKDFNLDNDTGRESVGDDHVLRAALRTWKTPSVDDAFNQKMFAAYRQQMSRAAETPEIADANLPAVSTSDAARASMLVNTSRGASEARDLYGYQKDSMMKYCPTCKEEFAGKFTFCPSDGTPLTEFASVGETANEVANAHRVVPVGAGITAQPEATNRAAAHNFAINGAATNGAASANGANGYDVTSDAAHADALNAIAPRGEYHLTIIEEQGIVKRLTHELREVAHQSQLTYPEFKRDPAGFTKRLVTAYGVYAFNTFKQPNVAIGTVSGIFLVALIVAAVLALNSIKPAPVVADKVRNDLQYLGEYQDIPEIEEAKEEPKPDKAIGDSDSDGRVGFNKGRGEGSAPQVKPATGGGGGGREEQLPPSRGQVPPASDQPIIVTPKPEPPKNPNPTLPVAVVSKGDKLLFPTEVNSPFGEPNSRSTTPSSGPGKGDGIGEGDGNNIGRGSGSGYGRGRGENMGGGDYAGPGGGGAGGGRGSNALEPTKSVYRQNEVTTKAVVLSTTEAPYTEEARKNQINGTVRLRVVLSANGDVTNIVPIQKLPYGLTEQAIAYAKRIKFKPATKDGRPVSQYGVLSFSFNMY